MTKTRYQIYPQNEPDGEGNGFADCYTDTFAVTFAIFMADSQDDFPAHYTTTRAQAETWIREHNGIEMPATYQSEWD